MNIFKKILLLYVAIISLAIPLLIPQITLAQTTSADADKFQLFPGEADSIGDFRLYIRNFYFFSIGASILVATILMMVGGMIWLTSAGNPTRVTKGKEYVTTSLIGIILLISAYAMLQVINPNLVDLNRANLPKIPAIGSCTYSSENITKCKIAAKLDCTKTLKGKYAEQLCTDKSICNPYNPTTLECTKNTKDGDIVKEGGEVCSNKFFDISIKIPKEQGFIDQIADFLYSAYETPVEPLILAQNRAKVSCISQCSAVKSSENKKCSGKVSGTALTHNTSAFTAYTSQCNCYEL